MKSCGVIIFCMFVGVMANGCRIVHPNHSRAKQLGLDYQRSVFDVSLTGSRLLDSNETYGRIVGYIRPVTNRVSLGERFVLSRDRVIYFEGHLSRCNMDRLILEGEYRGEDAMGNPVMLSVHAVVPLGIHGGIYYFREDDRLLSAAYLYNDYLQINKIKKSKSESNEQD